MIQIHVHSQHLHVYQQLQYRIDNGDDDNPFPLNWLWAETYTKNIPFLHLPFPTEAKAGDFHFQQHYMILLLALSLVYASLMHPKESYQIIYGFAYLFIFPAMHVLLPLYSIANIIDQSWGTRDGVSVAFTEYCSDLQQFYVILNLNPLPLFFSLFFCSYLRDSFLFSYL